MHARLYLYIHRLIESLAREQFRECLYFSSDLKYYLRIFLIFLKEVFVNQKSVFRNFGSDIDTCLIIPMPKLKAVLRLLLNSLFAVSASLLVLRL